MDWIKKHTDTVVVLSVLLSCVFWMNAKFNEIDSRFSGIEKELAVIKAVLVVKGIYPNELCKNENLRENKSQD
jgi:hypothetical protein